MTKYQEIKNIQPELKEGFFAFSDKQYKEGVEKNNLQGKKLYSGGMGLYGTHEGIKNFFAAIEAKNQRVTDECDPQEVYEYEFVNHECEYVGDDSEAFELVVEYFGEERANKVKRRCNW